MPSGFASNDIVLSLQNRILRHFDENDVFVEDIVTTDTTASAIQFDGDLNFYYWDLDGNAVEGTRELYKVTAAGVGPTLIYSYTPPAPATYPHWLAASMQYANGKLYCACEKGAVGDPDFVVFDTNGNLLEEEIVYSFTPPEDLSIDYVRFSVSQDGVFIYQPAIYSPDGITYYSRIYKINTSTWIATMWLEEVYGTAEYDMVWVLPNGNVMVSDNVLSRVDEYTSAAVFIRTVMDYSGATIVVDGNTLPIPFGGDVMSFRDDSEDRVHYSGVHWEFMFQHSATPSVVDGQGIYSYDSPTQTITKERTFQNGGVDIPGNVQIWTFAIASSAYQGLQRMNPDASIQWAKLDGF